MSKPILHDPLKHLLVASEARPDDRRLPIGVQPMWRWRGCSRPPLFAWPPIPSSGAIAYWKHEPLHDVVEPMADHVIMTYPAGSQRLERRTGKSAAIATARPGVVTVIPAGSTARWDIHEPMHVVQLYLPHRTLARVAGEADMTAPGDLLERTGHHRPHYIPIAPECGGCT